jgi:hypothetical protein
MRLPCPKVFNKLNLPVFILPLLLPPKIRNCDPLSNHQITISMRRTAFIVAIMSLVISSQAQFQLSLGMGIPKTEMWLDYIETDFIFPQARGGQWMAAPTPINTHITYGNNIPFYLKLAGKYKRLGYGINVNYGYFTYSESNYDYLYNNPNLQLVTSKNIKSRSTTLNLKVALFLIDKTKFNMYYTLALGLSNVDQSRSLYTFNRGNDYETYNGTVLGMEMGIGAHYYFHENVGVYLETGISKSFVQLGMVFKTNTPKKRWGVYNRHYQL